MFRNLVALIMVSAALGAGAASAADLDDRLDRSLRGAWATLEVEVYAGCSGTYSDNRVGEAGVASKAGRRFAEGELVKIDKVKVKRSRVDLLATLAVPVLETSTDGPFELYDERECRVQLIFELPRAAIRSGDFDAVMAAIGASLTTYPSRQAARNSGAWNGRERQPYPPDYEQTLARHRVWQAEQTNAAVMAGLERAITEAASAAEDIEDDSDYLAGFAAGVEKLQEITFGSCAQLIDASFSSWKKRPPSDTGKTWKRGFDDGQRLVFHVRLAHDLKGCFVPAPDQPLP